MDDIRRTELIATYRDGLLNDTLPFWIDHCVDHEQGGFMTSLDRDGTVIDTDKGVWQQGRFTWLLGELYNNVQPCEQWLELAKQGAQFMDAHCFDPSDGRMWFHVTRDGKPIRKRRYAFSESFAAIAYGELFKATGDQRYAEQAKQTFQRFLDHNLDPHSAAAKFTATRPSRGIGFPMITIATAQELRESVGLSIAQEWIDRSIADIRQYHLKEDIQCVMETVSATGDIIDHFEGRTLNPGHAIEGAWFIMMEGKLRGDEGLIQTGCQMLDWMWQRGWDNDFGGILYFVDVRGLPVSEYWHDMKFWWPQNEAIIATLLAFQLTGDSKYAEWHRMIHDWTYNHFPDPDHGEWFGYLHRDGSISSQLKGNLWKGPFHMPRMQLRCWQLLSESSC
ncbi:AGE family epimerase/isomerase [Stieleria sp. TO1_6]|uniref:AGE family epimerase/isomerase n=1 Tax=Stieleria tagensis TaxID=2956795 RepID=UPI00209B5581|nr:AGE family epimerase/isomerase [Stieleria tagensis]MCO8124780.1 AGE family epimerase/isomerase [Stieleria tagensis]